MYSLDVNFLKDRKLNIQLSETIIRKKAGPPITEQIPLIVGGVIMVLLPAATGGTLLLLNGKKVATEQAVAQLDAEISKLQGQSGELQQKQAEIDHIRQQTAAFAGVFQKIKPWSALLEDLRNRIPLNVQVDSIQQSEIIPAEEQKNTQAPPPEENKDKPTEEDTSKIPSILLSIKGTANDYDQINDFILSLQKSPFLNAEKIKLESTELVDNPNELVVKTEPTADSLDKNKPQEDKIVCENNQCTVEMANGDKKIFPWPKVVRYGIVAEVNKIPSKELLTALKETGAVGLFSRLQTLEQKGAISR